MRLTLDIIHRYIKDHKFKVITYLFLIIISYILGIILIPKLISSCINVSKNFGGLGIIKNIIDKTRLGYLYIIIISSIGFIFFDYLKNRSQNKILVDLSSKTRLEFTQKIFQDKLNNYQDLDEAEITSFNVNSYWSSRIFIRYLFEYLIPYLIIVIVIISFYSFFLRKPSLTVLIIVHLIMVSLLFKFKFKNLLQYAKSQEQEWEANMILLGEKMKNLQNIIFENNFNQEFHNIEDRQTQMNQKINQLYLNSDRLNLYSSILNYGLLVVLIIWIVMSFKNQKIPKVELTVIILIFLIYFNNLTNLTKESIWISHHILKLIRLDQKINATKNNLKYYSEVKLDNLDINIHNLYFVYPKSNNQVFKNFNFRIKANKINILLGSSGSGKSTLAKILLKLYPYDIGSITFGEYELKFIDPIKLRDKIYYCNQKTVLFNQSIMTNIQFGNRASTTIIKKYLKDYQLIDNFKQISFNLDYSCGINGSNLSMGMQKIIIILRAICKKDKDIFIFDEPLSGLDQTTRQKVVKLITQELKGKTILIITHDLDFNKYSNNINYL